MYVIAINIFMVVKFWVRINISLKGKLLKKLLKGEHNAKTHQKVAVIEAAHGLCSNYNVRTRCFF